MWNNSGGVFIYMAIRRPHKPPEAATEVFGLSQNVLSAYSSVGFPVDMVLGRRYDTTRNWRNFARLLGLEFLATNLDSSGANLPSDELKFDSNSGFYTETEGNPNIWYQFKRAPGFMDVVAYSGTGGNQNITHNLEVAPEFYMVKRRSATEDWATYSAALGANKYTKLNSNAASYTNTTIWNNTSPTNSVFTVGNDVSVNGSGSTYIAYLFATLPGISKVGSYTGNDAARTIDCGFTNGARFVLIKKTTAAGSWLVFDTTRGINAGNDPFIRLDLTDAQNTSMDVIDPHNSGFNLTSSAAANQNGYEYIFLAIA
jgi:hypothetical protein